MLENTFDGRPNHDRLHRIAEQIADHANVAGVRQRHEYREIGTMLPQRRV
jgi:hypothetical protein